MAENENAQHQDNQQPQQEAAPEPVFQLQRCYLKDASLEMPHAPEILLQAQQEQPQVDIKFEVSQKTVAEALYDVTVRGTITVKAADKVIILVEGTQSGLFAIHGIPVEALQHVTNVVCPAMVYPYLRANLADLMNRANVPPVHLPEVNFEVLYQQRLAQAQAEAEGARSGLIGTLIRRRKAAFGLPFVFSGVGEQAFLSKMRRVMLVQWKDCSKIVRLRICQAAPPCRI